jgi:hypothetical protein
MSSPMPSSLPAEAASFPTARTKRCIKVVREAELDSIKLVTRKMI